MRNLKYYASKHKQTIKEQRRHIFLLTQFSFNLFKVKNRMKIQFKQEPAQNDRTQRENY